MLSLKAVSYYDTLGVTRDASVGEIKRSYLAKSKQNHPDKGGDQAKQAELNRAYNCLSDTERRKRYDLTGEDIDKPIETDIHETIVSAFQQVLSAEEEIPSYLLAARKLIRFQLEQNNSNQREINKHIKKLKGRRDKIRVKPGKTNLFHAILDKQMGVFIQSVEQLKEEEKTLRGALEELNNYESDEEIPVATSQRGLRLQYFNPKDLFEDGPS